jgi:hypothetical protein
MKTPYEVRTGFFTYVNVIAERVLVSNTEGKIQLRRLGGDKRVILKKFQECRMIC